LVESNENLICTVVLLPRRERFSTNILFYSTIVNVRFFPKKANLKIIYEKNAIFIIWRICSRGCLGTQKKSWTPETFIPEQSFL